jgi:Cdc6-like AAA superfamily ATPase
MNKKHGFAGRRLRSSMRARAAHTVARGIGDAAAAVIPAIRENDLPTALPADALDDRIAIVGTAGSGKTYAAKGFVERLLDSSARVAIVDPLGVWWGLRASADGTVAGYPVVVFGGKHADVPITAEMGGAWQTHRRRGPCLRY